MAPFKYSCLFFVAGLADFLGRLESTTNPVDAATTFTDGSIAGTLEPSPTVAGGDVNATKLAGAATAGATTVPVAASDTTNKEAVHTETISGISISEFPTTQSTMKSETGDKPIKEITMAQMHENQTHPIASSEWESAKKVEFSKLQKIQQLLPSNGLDGYINPFGDEHKSEMPSESSKRNVFLSDFDCSNSLILVTEKNGGYFWTDGRYHLAASMHFRSTSQDPTVSFSVSNSEESSWKLMIPTEGSYLDPTTSFEQLGLKRVGFDPYLFSSDYIENLKEKNPSVLFLPISEADGTQKNLIDEIWEERPMTFTQPLSVMPDAIAGESSLSKLERLGENLKENNLNAIFVSSLPEIAYIFNLRGNDSPDDRTFMAYSFIYYAGIITVPEVVSVASSPTPMSGTEKAMSGTENAPATPCRPRTTDDHLVGPIFKFLFLKNSLDPLRIAPVKDYLIANEILLLPYELAPLAFALSPEALRERAIQLNKDYAYRDLPVLERSREEELHGEKELRKVGDKSDRSGESVAENPDNSSCLLSNDAIPSSSSLQVSLDPDTNIGMLKHVADHNVFHRYQNSIIREMKAIKNDAEIKGMIQAQALDGVAVSMLLALVENLGLENFQKLNEFSVAEKLKEIRRLLFGTHYIKDSFSTISSVDENGAIIHYSAKSPKSTDSGDGGLGKISKGKSAPPRPLNPFGLYLIDTGAHYDIGTTDATRVLHFGLPRTSQIDLYTRVLLGHVDVSLTKFPEKRPSAACDIDAFSRRYLWDAGYDYQHSLGHGVGHSLAVHETPPSLSSRCTAHKRHETIGINLIKKSTVNTLPFAPGYLQPRMIVSNEPGVYVEGFGGIRIENLLLIEKADFPYASMPSDYLQFRTITFLPYRSNMIDANMLTVQQLRFINDYHALVDKTLSNKLRELEAAHAKRQQTEDKDTEKGTDKDKDKNADKDEDKDKNEEKKERHVLFFGDEEFSFDQLLHLTKRWVHEQCQKL